MYRYMLFVIVHVCNVFAYMYLHVPRQLWLIRLMTGLHMYIYMYIMLQNLLTTAIRLRPFPLTVFIRVAQLT